MAKTEKIHLPKESELVVLTRRWEKQVAVSPTAEKGRVEGCLCIHTDPVSRKTLMCERYKTSLKHQKDIEESLGERYLNLDARERVKETHPVVYEKRDFFAKLSESDPCPIALMLSELSKAAPAAISVSVCAGYIPPEEQALLNVIEIKKRNREKDPASFISKNGARKLKRDMKTLYGQDAEAEANKRRGK